MLEALLYFSEFTAEDGTTRRPLLERLPELRPDGATVTGGKLTIIYELTRPVAGQTAVEAEPDPAIIAALCRCAVEDWLIAQLPPNGLETLQLWRCHNAQYIMAPMMVGSGHPTIHHALVAAAHAVADTQGVPH